MSELIQIITTTDSDTEATEIAKALLEARVAACVSISSPIKSSYLWKGRIDNAMEWQCRIKTKAELFERVEEIIKLKHSYEIPEIVAIPILDVNDEYEDWIEEELAG